MKSYSKPLVMKSNQRYENVQLESGCPEEYLTYCDAVNDWGRKCSKNLYDVTDDCKYLTYSSGQPMCTYNWPK